MISDFNATRGIAFSITNQNFEKAGYKFKKLDSVVEDRKNIKEHFNDLKFEEVIEAEDSLKKYKEGMNRLRAIAPTAKSNNFKLLIYVYCSSHGAMYNGAKMV